MHAVHTNIIANKLIIIVVDSHFYNISNMNTLIRSSYHLSRVILARNLAIPVAGHVRYASGQKGVEKYNYFDYLQYNVTM